MLSIAVQRVVNQLMGPFGKSATAVLAIALSANVSSGALITFTGTNGGPGTNGSLGNPGTNGGPGGPGGNATVVPVNDFGADQGQATGGSGGAGGTGGAGNVAGANGGNGGNGGVGGNATANRGAGFKFFNIATATAGAGGAGSAGGNGSPPGVNGSNGNGANGGTASAQTGRSGDDGGVPTQSTATATGGDGGDTTANPAGVAGIPLGGNGGSATADAAQNINTPVDSTAAGGDGGDVADAGPGSVGDGGTGGGAAASTVTQTRNATPVVHATATGGAGGDSVGAGVVAGTGGSASTNQFHRRSTATLQGNATGGAGGSGLRGATGGTGGNATTNIDGTGGTNVILNQTANGGAGGNSDTGPGGNGGNASHTMNNAGSLVIGPVTFTATGGAGGSVQNAGASANGGNGGTATAGVNTPGAGTTNLQMTANGGAGGTGRGAGNFGGNGGAATATADDQFGPITGNPPTNFVAHATGGAPGAGLGGATAGRPGNATATVVTGSFVFAPRANVTAEAIAIGGLDTRAFGSGSAMGSANVVGQAHSSNGGRTGEIVRAANADTNYQTVSTNSFGENRFRTTARAQLGGAAPTFPDRQEAGAIVVGSPTAADVNSRWAEDTDVSSSFGGNTNGVFGLVSLAAAHPQNLSGVSGTLASANISSSATFAIDTSALTTGDELLLGLLDFTSLDPSVGGSPAGNNPIRFRVFREGVTILDVVGANPDAAYFEDHPISLGSATAGVTGDLHLVFQLEIGGTDLNVGMQTDFVIGVVPEPGMLGLTAVSAACTLLSRRRRARSHV